LLKTELLKSGQTVNIQLVVTSFCPLLRAWNKCRALAENFGIASSDTTQRDLNERNMQDEFMKNITHSFLLHLSLICDVLQRLQAFLELQARNMDLYQHIRI
jgi:hypothetical protein